MKNYLALVGEYIGIVLFSIVAEMAWDTLGVLIPFHEEL